MRSPESASSASLKAAIGLLHGSEMYALHTSHIAASLSHYHLRNSYFITKNGSLLRTRTEREPG